MSSDCCYCYFPVCKDVCKDVIKEWNWKVVSPMPWMGMYIAAASVACTLAMAVDVFRAFRTKRLWFPCKLFTLNATSLTLLAVAMKLPLDITTDMDGSVDQLAKLSGSVFMTAVIGNFMTSLGRMNGATLIMNITAANILVITIIVDMYIQLGTGVVAGYLRVEGIIVNLFMFVLLLILSFSALAVPATKKYLEVKYHQHMDEEEEELVENGKLTTKKLELAVKKLWMMAETSSPQFVMARSVTSNTTGLICLLNALASLKAWITYIRWYRYYDHPRKNDSDYGWSTMYILVIQGIGVGIGTISPVMRWFLAVSFKRSEKRSGENKKKFNVEPYWIEKLIEWKQRPLPLQIGGRKSRKFLQYMKNLILNVFIRVQVVIVKVSKLVLLISVSLVSPIFSCFHLIKRLKGEDVPESGATHQHGEQESEVDTGPDFGRYVLFVEGEAELPKRTWNKILYGVDQLIQTGKKHQPKNLLQLLKKSSSFNGLKHFDRIQVPTIHPDQEPPNCWTLPVVTLTSIAIAVASPNVETRLVDELVSSVTEGIRYARLVDKSLEGKRNSENVTNTTDEVWVGVELYYKWLDEDLMTISRQAGKTSNEILRKLSEIAKQSLAEFKENTEESLMKNPRYWPVRIVAANSMCRTSSTMLLMCEEMNNKVDNEGLFNHLSIMIADILSACLTNLPHVIVRKGQNTKIEEREESVRHAARLLGETEDILQLLEGREIPSLDPDKAVDIDEWRALIDQDDSTASTPSSELHVTVDIGT